MPENPASPEWSDQDPPTPDSDFDPNAVPDEDTPNFDEPPETEPAPEPESAPEPSGADEAENANFADNLPRYAGFWRRWGALALDNILLGVASNIYYGLVHGFARLFNLPVPAELFTALGFMLISVLYFVVLVKCYGGTLGKQFLKCRIVHHQTQSYLTWGQSSRRVLFSILYALIISGAILHYAATAPAVEPTAAPAPEFLAPENPEGENTLVPRGAATPDNDYPPYLLLSLLTGLFLFLIGYLMPLFNERRRALHDFLAGSQVILIDSK